MQVATKSKIVNQPTVYRILFAISFVHLLNDSIQAVIPAIFPILEESMGLNYLQLGVIAFALNITSSIMQPVVGLYTDRKPSPFLPPLGMVATLLGMLGLALAPNYTIILISVILVGVGSAVFHPEGSRVAYMAAGERRGLAQSIYQVGGNFGTSLAPIMTALIFVPLGQFGAIWFTIAAALAIMTLTYIATWSRQQLLEMAKNKKTHAVKRVLDDKIKKQLGVAIVLLIVLVFARSWYTAAISNFYVFYLIHEYDLTIKGAQPYIFIFLFMGVIGTFIGGPIADRFGKKNVILYSMLGSAPLAILLPHVKDTLFIYPILLLLGVILLSSFSVTVVYAQDLFPGKVGTVSGLIVGLAFGLGALGSVALGAFADVAGLKNVMVWVSFLPVLGLITYFLPSDQKLREWAAN